MFQLNLLKKHFLVLDSQAFLVVLISAFISIFVGSRFSNALIILLMMSVISEYVAYSSIASLEYKHQGEMYLAITPYGKRSIVISRFLFVNIIYLMNICIFLILSQITYFDFGQLKISHIFIVFFVINFLFSFFIPLEIKYGYEKLKYILILFTIFIPVWGLGLLINIIKRFKVDLANVISILMKWNGLLLFICGVLLLLVSLFVSIKLSDKKEF